MARILQNQKAKASILLR